VECSERRHQKNRRTEFKVIGYVHNQLLDNQSLFEMKEVEKMEALLSELANSEIKVAEGETMPDDLKKQLEAQEKKKSVDTKKKESKSTTSEKKKTSVAKRELAAKKRRNETADTLLVKTANGQIIKLKVIDKDRVPSKKDQKVPTPENMNKPKANNTTTPERGRVVEEVVVEEEMPVFEDTSVDDSFETESELIEEEMVKMVPEQEVTTNSFVKAPKKLNKDFTGFKVQIVISTYELPLSHEIFSRHGNIMLEETNKGTYAYLLGKFNNKSDASDFMNRVLSERYANARVVEYLEGRRIVR